MTYQTVKLRRHTLEAFKAACAANGDKVNTVLREAIERYIELHPVPPGGAEEEQQEGG